MTTSNLTSIALTGIVVASVWLTSLDVQAQTDVAAPGYVLQRAVVVMRHGVRPPTRSAADLQQYSDQAWPDNAAWGAAPGELTPHGALAITRLGQDLRSYYAQTGLIPASGASALHMLVWADGADQRTRATAQRMAAALSGDNPSPGSADWVSGKADPLFDGLGSGICKLNKDLARQAVLAQSPIDTPEVQSALRKMQNVLAPEACSGGRGMCLNGVDQLTVSEGGVKLTGPLATGATVSEALVLEYENGLPMNQVGFGRVDAASIAALQVLHEQSANLTRRTPYIATRRAYALTRFILDALEQDSDSATVPAINEQQHLILLVGHDTNLSNLAGVFGLDWHLDQQPDSTAPGTALAFERWHNPVTGQTVLRMRLFYQTLDQVRQLSGAPARQIPIEPAACRHSGACDVAGFAAAIDATLPKDCTP